MDMELKKKMLFTKAIIYCVSELAMDCLMLAPQEVHVAFMQCYVTIQFNRFFFFFTSFSPLLQSITKSLPWLTYILCLMKLLYFKQDKVHFGFIDERDILLWINA